MTTSAPRTARAYVSELRPYAEVRRLLQDERDFYEVLGLRDRLAEWPLHDAPLFLSKTTGRRWSASYAEVAVKIEGMR